MGMNEIPAVTTKNILKLSVDKSVDDKSISFGGKSYIVINNMFYPTASTSTNSTCSNLLCVDTISLVDFPEISKSDGVNFDQMIRKDDQSVITWYGEPSSSDGVGSMNFVLVLMILCMLLLLHLGIFHIDFFSLLYFYI